MLAKRLKELRKLKRKTQQDVADYLGITRPAYTAYEQGNRNPDYDLLDKLASYFNVSTDYLLGREDKKNPSWGDQEEFEAWVNDPSVDKFYREFKESPEERKKALLAVWEILKTQGK